MHIATMHARLNELKSALEEKGMKNVSARFEITEVGPYNVNLIWRDALGEPDSFNAFWWEYSMPEEMIEACAAHIKRLPEADDARRAAAYKLLAQVKEKFDEFGIEADFTNPIEEMMKKLSTNALR